MTVSGSNVPLIATFSRSQFFNVTLSVTMIRPLYRVSDIKVKSLDTCYSTAYVCQTEQQQCFAISKVAADWHEVRIV